MGITLNPEHIHIALQSLEVTALPKRQRRELGVGAKLNPIGFRV